jgi:hypothetical protein
MEQRAETTLRCRTRVPLVSPSWGGRFSRRYRVDGSIPRISAARTLLPPTLWGRSGACRASASVEENPELGEMEEGGDRATDYKEPAAIFRWAPTGSGSGHGVRSPEGPASLPIGVSGACAHLGSGIPDAPAPPRAALLLHPHLRSPQTGIDALTPGAVREPGNLPRPGRIRRPLRPRCALICREAAAQQSSPEGTRMGVERELRALVLCGSLAGGFCRARCEACGHSVLVAFSCKGHLCTSYATARMHQLVAHLTQNVLPTVPFRLWTVSFPFDLPPLRLAVPPPLRVSCRHP